MCSSSSLVDNSVQTIENWYGTEDGGPSESTSITGGYNDEDWDIDAELRVSRDEAWAKANGAREKAMRARVKQAAEKKAAAERKKATRAVESSGDDQPRYSGLRAEIIGGQRNVHLVAESVSTKDLMVLGLFVFLVLWILVATIRNLFLKRRLNK